jgi:hypothetical protein
LEEEHLVKLASLFMMGEKVVGAEDNYVVSSEIIAKAALLVLAVATRLEYPNENFLFAIYLASI